MGSHLAAGNPDAAGHPKPPPGLKVSDIEGEECEVCVHYSDGKCMEYNSLPVDTEWWCRSFVRDPKKTDEDPSTLDEARIAVKAHFRRRRQPGGDLSKDMDRGGRPTDEKRNKISGTDY